MRVDAEVIVDIESISSVFTREQCFCLYIKDCPKPGRLAQSDCSTCHKAIGSRRLIKNQEDLDNAIARIKQQGL